MNILNYILAILWIILCNDLLESVANPLIGEGVRLAHPNEFPFIVSIGERFYRGCDVNHFCTGSLITMQHVLTAAHCTENKTINEIQVTVGSNRAESGQILDLISMITYTEWYVENYGPGYNTEADDVAIMTLDGKVFYPGITLPIISNARSSIYDDKDVMTAGWGIHKAENGNYVTPYYMQTAELKVLSRYNCTEYLRGLTGLRKNMPGQWMCSTSEPRIIFGNGDSGGPLLYEKNTIIGVNACTCPGVKCVDDVTVQNIHINIEYVKDFIDAIITQ